MNLNEPIPSLRVIRARLFDNTRAPLAPDHAFGANDLKIMKPDNTIADASARPVARKNATLAGSFDIQVSMAELSQLGEYVWQLRGEGLSDWEWVETVTRFSGATIKLGEPIAALRMIRARLSDDRGAPLDPGHVFAPGDLKLLLPDNTISNASALPVPRPNAILEGSFDIQIDQSEISMQPGTYCWQLKGAGLSDWEWLELVDVTVATRRFFLHP